MNGREDRRESLRKLARSLSVALALLLGVLVISGLAHSRAASLDVHRWSGHLLVVLSWLAIPSAILVLLFQQFRLGPVSVFVRAGALLFLLCITLLESFTGYLGPTHAPGQSEVTTNRFVIMHIYLLPSLISFLVYLWWRFFRADLPTDRIAHEV